VPSSTTTAEIGESLLAASAAPSCERLDKSRVLPSSSPPTTKPVSSLNVEAEGKISLSASSAIPSQERADNAPIVTETAPLVSNPIKNALEYVSKYNYADSI
jgi:hypothetical protein